MRRHEGNVVLHDPSPIGRAGHGRSALHQLGQVSDDRLGDREQQVILGAEVVVERRLGEAETLGDLPGRGRGKPVVGDQLQGGCNDARPGLVSLLYLAVEPVGFPSTHVE